jgi:hypothetical protein
MNTLGLLYNTSNLAVTQFNNFPFKGLCLVDEQACGVNDDGIFQLFTGQRDSEIEINSKIVFGPTDFGISNPKRVRLVDIGCRCSGSLNVTVTDEEGRSFTKTGTTNTHLYIPEQIIIYGDRNVRGRYLTVTIENAEGCDFELLSVDVSLTILRQVRT